MIQDISAPADPTAAAAFPAPEHARAESVEEALDRLARLVHSDRTKEIVRSLLDQGYVPELLVRVRQSGDSGLKATLDILRHLDPVRVRTYTDLL